MARQDILVNIVTNYAEPMEELGSSGHGRLQLLSVFLNICGIITAEATNISRVFTSLGLCVH